MSSYTDVRVGGLSYAGSSRGSYDPQATLFTVADLVRDVDEDGHVVNHVYRITIAELRRRLDLLGFSVLSVHASLQDLVTPLLKWPEARTHDIPYGDLMHFALALSPVDLVQMVREWHRAELRRQSRVATIAEIEAYTRPNISDHADSVLTLLRGEAPFLWPHEAPVLQSFAFERLLCEAVEDDCAFEFDMTQVLQAGYFRDGKDPVGYAFDEQLASINPDAFVKGATVSMEESETVEFKSITSGAAVESIVKQLPKYVIGFLNQVGGSIYFGISDDGIVEGVTLRRDQRDELQRKIVDRLAAITPAIPRGEIQIRLRPVIGAAHLLQDRHVVQIEVSQGPAHQMYFKEEETWVRFGTQTRALAGHALFTHILAAYHAVRDLSPRPPAMQQPAGETLLDSDAPADANF